LIAFLLPYLLLCWGLGFWLTFLSRMEWPLEGRVAMGIPLGFGMSALLTWLVAIPIGMSGLAVALGAAVMFAALAACLRWTSWRTPLRSELTGALLRWRTRQPLPLLLVFIPMALFLTGFFTHALDRLPTGLYAGHPFLAFDWADHMMMAGYLSHAQQLLPPNNPGYTGINLDYPFMSDFFSGQLLHLGLDLETALPLASCLLCMAFVVILYVTALRFVANRWAAFVATLLLLLVGGVGFFSLTNDIMPTGYGVLGWLGGLGTVLSAPPIDYSWQQNAHIFWGTPMVNYLLPQRSILLGWPLGLLALSLLWHGLKTNSRREFLLAGIVVGLLPPFHANTFLALFVFISGIALLTFRQWRRWAWFYVPAVALGTPLMYMLLPNPDTSFPLFFSIQPGWMAGIPGQEVNWFWFWWINAGLFVPLAAAASIFVWRTRPDLARFLLPGWLLFIVANVFRLQIYVYDNNKWLMWWAIPACMMVGLLIARVASKGRVLAALAAFVVIFQSFGGVLSLDNAFQQKLNLASSKMLDPDEVAVGDWVRQQTDPAAVFLTGVQVEHPVRVLGGRAMVVGGVGSLIGTDIDSTSRSADVNTMLQGAPETPVLLNQYGVGYVVIGPTELRDAGANLNYYRTNYPLAYMSPTGEYQIFKVS